MTKTASLHSSIVHIHYFRGLKRRSATWFLEIDMRMQRTERNRFEKNSVYALFTLVVFE